MYQYKGIEDTIAAISTAMGQGGIGIVRLSGKGAVASVDQLFVAKNKKPLTKAEHASVTYGWIVNKDDNKEIIDEVLVTVMRAPRSYTREDVVEVSCHGGVVSLRAILKEMIDSGVRLAEPGEFTKRAFLNGRIDLTQAEAVLDIIQAKTDTFLRVSTNQLKGELSVELETIRESLMTTYVEIEAIVNFPEDDIDSDGRKKIIKDVKTAKERINKLLESSEQGRVLKEGIKLVLCGKPNVGKSSLLNILLKTPRAIVSDIAGTTRDTIEEVTQINGIPFQLVDTAGILEPRDLIEEEAVKRSHMYMEGADLVLLVLDGSQSFEEQDESIIEVIRDQHVLIIINKSDLEQEIDESKIKEYFPKSQLIKVSAIKNSGIEELQTKIVEEVCHSQRIDTHGVLISNLRHINSLKNAHDALLKVEEILDQGESFEFASEEIKLSVNYLDAITGKNIDQDLLDTIFSQFCIGK